MMTHENEEENKETTSFHQNPNSLSSFIEPPSYAEAVFKSFDHDHGDNSGATSAPSTTSDYLKITVTYPKKEIDIDTGNNNNNNYTTYLITTRTNSKEFNGTEFSVRRRFSDFVKLSERLSESYRGYFMPIRPDKGVVESQVMQKVEFVEMRRNDLEKYLRKLCDHLVIRNSEDLRVFLKVKGKVEFVKSENVVGVGVGVGRGELVRRFKELRQSVTYGWGGTKAPLVVEEDMEFLEKRRKLREFEVRLGNVSVQAESLVKAQQDIGETMGDLGLAFVKLAKFETGEAVYISQQTRAGDMKNVATSAVKASRLYRELNEQTIKHLDKLHDYLGVMLDVNSAYSDRSNALLTVQTLVSELTTLNSRIRKLEAIAFKVFGEDRSRIQKIEELKETMRVTEDAKSHAVKEYERIKEINKTEFQRLDKERHDDFLGMLKGFVVNQAGYAEKLASVWETIANKTSEYAPKL